MPRALTLFLRWNVALYLVCVVCKVVARLVFGLKFQYSHIFLQERFPDYLNLVPAFADFHRIEFFTRARPIPVMYPAATAVFFEPFMLAGHWGLRIFVGIILMAFAGAAWIFARTLVRTGLTPVASAGFVGLALLFSYPLLFEWKQANIEIVVWCLLGGALCAFFARWPYVAAVCIGIAGAMKIFPLVYAGLLISRRQYRALAVCFGTVGVATVASLWLVYPSIGYTWRATNVNVALFRTMYMLHLRPEIGFDHSLWGLLKVLDHEWVRGAVPPPAVLSPYLSAYMAVAAIAGFLLYFLRIRRLPLANQVLCLCIASIMLPPVSFDYTLIHLYGPWAIFVLLSIREWRAGRAVRHFGWIFVPFAVLFSPESEFIYRGDMLGGQIKAVALVVLFCVGLLVPFDASGEDAMVPESVGVGREFRPAATF